MIQFFLPVLRKLLKLWLAMAALGLIVAGCGGGGGGSQTSEPSIPPEPPVNQRPTATIAEPTSTYFKEGDNIAFSGSGIDDEDGELNSDALVWTSSIDGPIGTGPTVITSALSTGEHEITLTVTDSEGEISATILSELVQIVPTRAIKMGRQTTGVPDASNAFDGDRDIAATLMTADTEFVHFKAHVGGAETFLFKIKIGASASTSSLAIEGLDAEDTWRSIDSIAADADKTVLVKITEPQLSIYLDAEGYINLRVLWAGGEAPDSLPVYEIWRVDPVYAGPMTTASESEAAFDGDASTAATLSTYQSPSDITEFLHFKAYVGTDLADVFTFRLTANPIGTLGQYLVIGIEDPASAGTWNYFTELPLPVAGNPITRNFQIPPPNQQATSSVQGYLDAAGYISLRAYWSALNPILPPGTSAEIIDISRIDPVLIGPQTFGVIQNADGAIDGDPSTYAQIDYFWGEADHEDFLHFQSYVGDSDYFAFSIQTEASAPGSVLIIEGEQEPDSWADVTSIALDEATTTTVELPNAQPYVNADGFISLRARWESDSTNHDARIAEIVRLPE